jgi:hypothetical protein
MLHRGVGVAARRDPASERLSIGLVTPRTLNE